MGRISYIALSLAAACGVSACSIKNDMQLPKISADITTFEIYGQVSSRIDIRNYTVSVVLSEDQNPEELNIKTVKFSEGAKCSDKTLADGHAIDLSEPYTVTLSMFRDYVWTITAEQPVERYVKCENQVGSEVILPEDRKINIRVKPAVNSAIDSRTHLKITDMKLGLKGSSIVSTTDYLGNTEVISGFPVTLDCFYERKFTVREKDGSNTVWTMIALPSE